MDPRFQTVVVAAAVVGFILSVLAVCVAVVLHQRQARELSVKCGWCGEHLRGPEDGPVSHGCCPACHAKLLRELDDLKQQKDHKRHDNTDRSV